MVSAATIGERSTPFSEVELYDEVLAYNEATGELGYYPVVAIWAHEDPVIITLTVDGEVIETTPEHPFYRAEGEWVAAGELRAGDEVWQAAGSAGEIEHITITLEPQVMYNFTVATAHTYFVGEGQWLVHNACIDDYMHLFADATPGRRTLGRTTQYDLTGGMQKAQQIFDSMDFSDVRIKGSTQIGFLADGTTVSLYPLSSGGHPSIKIQRPGTSRVTAYRFLE